MSDGPEISGEAINTVLAAGRQPWDVVKEQVMANVLHFAVDGGPVACGAQVFLCDDYTDDQRYVDCKRCRKTKAFINYDPRRFDVDVWNHEGDVIRWFKRVTADEVDDIRREYEGEPGLEVVATEVSA